MKKRNVYYIFNPDTRTYERVYPRPMQKFLTVLRRCIYYILFGGISFVAFSYIFDKPVVKDSVVQETKEVMAENEQLAARFKVLSERLDRALLVQQDIQQRDDNLYRVILDAEPMTSIRNAGYAGTNRYDDLLKMENSELLLETTQKIDLLEKQLYYQVKSFDELVKLDKESEERLRHIPSIQPIANRDLKRTASGYGYRIDPVYNVRTFHKGMDFSCDKRTPVYATADGVIESAKWQRGYGYTVVIDHGFGYKTLYAHLLDKKFLVRRGQKVVRGEQIALSGNSGKSTGPHLHYEVIVKGEHVNPVNYYFMDLDAEGYDQMLQMAENHGKIYD
ncbi:MAG: M23 family metallopeptidase [Bacteroidaceae bacterium]|nr:M23 family metallopeptidase [Bacteroidaceae bacterium]